MKDAAVKRLERIAARWRRRWSVAALFVVLAAAAVALILGAGVALSVLVASLVALLLVWRRPRVDAFMIALHLDRSFASMEESTTLLLVPPGGFSPVERLQRARAERAFASLPSALTMPERPTLQLVLGTLFLAVVAILIVRFKTSTAETSHRPGSRASAPAPAIESVGLIITDPGYLGGRTHRASADADAFEGSRLEFDATLTNATAGWLITTNGDSFPLGAGQRVRLDADRSFLYQVMAIRDTARTVGDWHRVTVLPDRPPLLTVVRPDERTILPPTRPWNVPVEILASDDHGIATVRLLATITTGSGEDVRFREDTLPFASRESRGGGLLLRTTLDLAALGMGPGDELYLSAQAFDGRRPVPNEGRSATLFISITDTAQVMEAEFDGLAIDRMPDYFRSQRQIIIDTEKLLTDRPHLSVAEFRRRSNDIGIDQQLLRLRYSEMVGDESAEESDAMSWREHAAEGGAPTPRLDPNAAAVADPNAKVTVDLTQGEGHSHDIAENATLLARSTKELLRLALGQMWQAELRLRTFYPDTALPHERSALEYLEAVRQAARSYVKRVGLEPPPLEPDRKRLTGKLDDVRSAHTDARVAARDTLPAIRALLAGRVDHSAFEAAGRELARLTVGEPGRHLSTLRELRAVEEGIARGEHCEACALRLRAGLLAALPVPIPPAAAADPTPAVVGRYFERMRRP